MNRFVLITAVTSLLLFASCSKTNSNLTPSAGSWTLNGNTTYLAVACKADPNNPTALIANTATDPAASILEVNFYPNLPTAPGTYGIASNDSVNTSPNKVQVYTNLAAAGVSYGSDGTGTNPTVTVTVNNGKLTVKGSGIHIKNNTSATTLAFDIVQTN